MGEGAEVGEGIAGFKSLQEEKLGTEVPEIEEELEKEISENEEEEDGDENEEEEDDDENEAQEKSFIL